MATLLRYLLSFAVQLAWQRSGRGGAVPPIRMPVGKNRGKTVPLPIIAPWQIMAAMWVANRAWQLYGDQVINKVQNSRHPLVGHLLDWLPDSIYQSLPKTNTQAKNNTHAANTPLPASTPGASNPPAAASSARPAPPQYQTRQLDDDSAPQTSTSPAATTPLPPGSILSDLRGTNG